jgi:hypothetical protein
VAILKRQAIAEPVADAGPDFDAPAEPVAAKGKRKADKADVLPEHEQPVHDGDEVPQ